MEGLDAKLERVQGDVSNLISLYDFAEKQYTYDKIREPMQVSSHISSNLEAQFDCKLFLKP